MHNAAEAQTACTPMALVPDQSFDLEPCQVIHLNCLMLGDPPARIFPVEIASTDTVGNLKDAIYDKNQNTFQQIDAKFLDLWKVTIPADKSLQGNLDKLQVNFFDGNFGKSLLPIKCLFEVFLESPLPNHVHVIVTSPSNEKRASRTGTVTVTGVSSVGKPLKSAKKTGVYFMSPGQ